MPRPTPGTDNRVLRVCRLLNRHRARYLLAGGVAANLHGSVRATRGIDILVPRDSANMVRVLGALSELPHGIARELDAAEVAGNPITIVGDDPRVDSERRLPDLVVPDAVNEPPSTAVSQSG